MAIPVETVLLIFGGLIFVGYFGELLSKRFSVPSALLLLAIGFTFKLTGFVNVESFIGFQDIFSTLALIILLFDGGLSLNIFEVLFKSGRVLAVGFIITVLSMIGTGLLFMLMGFNPLIGAILGAIAGGLGSSTTISIVKGLSLPPEIKNYLVLESSITDVFSIIFAIVFTQALVYGTFDISFISQGIVGRFSIGAFLGIMVGVASILMLSRIEKGYNYVITFAIMLILYSVAEFLGGSGAISVLTFGLLLGNEVTVRKIVRSNHQQEYPVIQEFQSEISFFVRTFFFVFLGIIVSLGNVTNFIVAFALMVLLYLIRYAVVYFSTMKSPFFNYYKVLSAINPRGLATAALATYPLMVVEQSLQTGKNAYLSSLIPHLSALSEISFYLIILSIVFTTILVPISMKKDKSGNGNNSGLGAENPSEEVTITPLNQKN